MKDKETFYFSHDYNSREDEKVKELVFQYGMTGYGIYWALVEMLYQNANALRTNYARIAFDLHQSTHVNVQAIIEDFDLFSFNEDRSFFYSNSIQRRLEKRDEKSKKARESALNRWGKSESNANASKTQSEPDAIKESKGKENKVKDNFLLEKETKEILSDFEKDIDDHLKIPTSVNTETKEAKKVALKKVSFKPPSLQEVQEYCNERQNGIQAFTFVNFYQSKGWLIGKNPMKDWKAAIHTWESKNKEQNGNSNTGQSNSNSGNATGHGFKNPGKVSARTVLAKRLAEQNKNKFSDSDGGNFTVDAEIVN